jgi:hypothetical protein
MAYFPGKPHPWDDEDWREYLRRQRREERRHNYQHETAADLARADAELVLLLAELEMIPRTAGLTQEMLETIAAEIRQLIEAQQIRIDWLVREMDRVKPNWRSWLDPTDPRYDPTEYPHAHIGNGTADGGYPPDEEARYGSFTPG